MIYNSLENTNVSIYSHTDGECTGDVCVFHKRSDHHMRKFRQFYRVQTSIMYRVCTHGIQHPDPDDEQFRSGAFDGDHDCDACCIRFASVDEYDNESGND